MSEVIEAIETAIRSELGAEAAANWGKQQIVVVTGGQVTDTTEQRSGAAKFNFRVVVPPEYSAEEGFSVELTRQRWPPADIELFIKEWAIAVLKNNVSMDGIRVELSEGPSVVTTATTTTAATTTSRTTTTSGLRRLQELASRPSPRRLADKSVLVTMIGTSAALADLKALLVGNSGNCFFAAAATISYCEKDGAIIGKGYISQPKVMNQTAYAPKVARWNSILAALSNSPSFEKQLEKILAQSTNPRVNQLPPGFQILPNIADVVASQAWLSDLQASTGPGSSSPEVWTMPDYGTGTSTDDVVQQSAAGAGTAFLGIGAVLFVITVCFTGVGTKRLKRIKKKINSVFIKDYAKQNPQIKPAPESKPDLGASFDAQIPSDRRPKRIFDLEVHPIVEDVIVDPPMQAISMTSFDDVSSHGNDGGLIDDWTYQPEINFLSDAEATLPARPQSAQSAREWSFIEKEWDQSKIDDEIPVRLTKIPTLPPRAITAPPGARRSTGGKMGIDDWGDMMAGFWEGSDTPRSGTTTTPVSTRRPSLRAQTPPERSRPGTPALTQKETFQPNQHFSKQPDWAATPIRREGGLDADRAETPVTPLTPTLRSKLSKVPWDIHTEDKSGDYDTIYALFSPSQEVLPVQSMPGGLAFHSPLVDKGDPGSGIDDIEDSLTLPHSIPDDTLQSRTGGSLLDQSVASSTNRLIFDEMRHARDVLGAIEGIPSVRSTTPPGRLDTGRSWQTGKSEGRSYWGDDSAGLQTPKAFSTPIESGGDRLQVAMDFASASVPPNYILSPTFAQQQSQSMVGISAERWAPTATPGRVQTPTIAPPEMPRTPAVGSSLPSEPRTRPQSRQTDSSWRNMQDQSPWFHESPTGSTAPVMDPYHMTFAPVYQDPAQMSGLRESATHSFGFESSPEKPDDIFDSFHGMDSSLHTVQAEDAWRAQTPPFAGTAAAWGGRDPTSPLAAAQTPVGQTSFDDSLGMATSGGYSPEVIQEARRWLPADRRADVEASLWDANGLPRAEVPQLNFEPPGYHPQALMLQTVEEPSGGYGGYGFGQLPELGNLVPTGVGASWQSPTAVPSGPPRIPGLPQALQDQLRPRSVAEDAERIISSIELQREAEWHGTPPYSRPVPVRVPGLPDSLRVASPESSSGLPRHLQLTGRSRVSEWGDDSNNYEWDRKEVENSWGGQNAYRRDRSVSPTGASTVTPSFNFQKSTAPRTLPTFDLEAFNQYENAFTKAVVEPPPLFYPMDSTDLSMLGLPREVPTLGGAVPRGLGHVPSLQSLPSLPDLGNGRPGQQPIPGMGPAGNWGSEGSVSGTYSGNPSARSWTNAAEDVWD